jgi:hypothetical protein
MIVASWPWILDRLKEALQGKCLPRRINTVLDTLGKASAMRSVFAYVKSIKRRATS